MEISSPLEPVYYYEVNAGRVRLTYFIPLDDLARLVEQGHISPPVLEDFPDGVDLDCTEPDFEEFDRLYGYRPPSDPERLQQAFYALFSSTRGWRRFRGTGLIPKTDLEGVVEPVTQALEQSGSVPIEPGPRTREYVPLPQRLKAKTARAKEEARARKTLERLDVQGVDKKRDLRDQKFAHIHRSPGRPAVEVFDELHRGQRRG